MTRSLRFGHVLDITKRVLRGDYLGGGVCVFCIVVCDWVRITVCGGTHNPKNPLLIYGNTRIFNREIRRH